MWFLRKALKAPHTNVLALLRWKLDAVNDLNY